MHYLNRVSKGDVNNPSCPRAVLDHAGSMGIWWQLSQRIPLRYDMPDVYLITWQIHVRRRIRCTIHFELLYRDKGGKQGIRERARSGIRNEVNDGGTKGMMKTTQRTSVAVLWISIYALQIREAVREHIDQFLAPPWDKKQFPFKVKPTSITTIL